MRMCNYGCRPGLVLRGGEISRRERRHCQQVVHTSVLVCATWLQDYCSGNMLFVHARVACPYVLCEGFAPKHMHTDEQISVKTRAHIPPTGHVHEGVTRQVK